MTGERVSYPRSRAFVLVEKQICEGKSAERVPFGCNGNTEYLTRQYPVGTFLRGVYLAGLFRAT